VGFFLTGGGGSQKIDDPLKKKKNLWWPEKFPHRSFRVWPPTKKLNAGGGGDWGCLV